MVSNASPAWAVIAVSTGIAALGLAPVSAAAAERASARLECATTDKSLVYDCTIALATRAHAEPVTGAEVVVKAEMPSMPMAHNVPPARAEPTGKPGEYRTNLALEMHGEWLITIDVGGPLRDRVLVKRDFKPAGAATAPAHAHGSHRHGAHGGHGAPKADGKPK